MKYLIFILLILLLATVSFAQDSTATPSIADNLTLPIGQASIPSVPGDFAIQPGGIGENTPTDFAPAPGACDSAAGSYLEAGMTAIRSTSVTFGDIVYDNKDQELVLYALYALEATELLASRNRFVAPDDLTVIGPFNDGEIVTMGSESACVDNGVFTARFWQLDNGEWVVDTISVKQPLDITAAWPVQLPSPQNPGEMFAAPQFPVLVEDVVFRYLVPYIAPPVTTIPAADQFAANNAPQVVCEHGAPSYLNVGMDVMLSGYGYERMPTLADLNAKDDWINWTFDETQFPLGAHGMTVFLTILNDTALLGTPGSNDTAVVSVADLFSGTSEPQGTILDGPICTEVSTSPDLQEDCGCTTKPCSPCTQGTGDDPERFTTWWKVEVNGAVGWYPENAGQYSWWLYQTDGIFPRKLFLYYMIPANEMMQAQAAACPPSGLYAGQNVQPASGAMNLRAAPGGAVIGRVDGGQMIAVFGEPVCEGGANWWQTSVGGYIAENDPESQLPLLKQAVLVQPDPIVTDEPQPLPLIPDESQLAPIVTEEAQPAPVVPEEPTREPESPREPVQGLEVATIVPTPARAISTPSRGN